MPKCIFQVGEVGPFQTSPIVRDGRMYVTTAHRTLALDAATCKPLWTHEYVPAGPELRPLNRGVALYQGMVIRGACDGHLFALDAATGKLLWDVWVADSRKGYWLAAAPVVFDGKVFIGEAGADTGANGHVYAFDAATGRLLWTFDLIPDGPPARRRHMGDERRCRRRIDLDYHHGRSGNSQCVLSGGKPRSGFGRPSSAG